MRARIRTGYSELVLELDCVDEIAQRECVRAAADGPLVPERDVAVGGYFRLATRARLGEQEERDADVEEQVAEFVESPVALHQLAQLDGHEAGHARRGRRYGGHDLAGDALHLQLVGRLDRVHACAQVGHGEQEVNVSVGVVVLLEVNGPHGRHTLLLLLVDEAFDDLGRLGVVQVFLVVER